MTKWNKEAEWLWRKIPNSWWDAAYLAFELIEELGIGDWSSDVEFWVADSRMDECGSWS